MTIYEIEVGEGGIKIRDRLEMKKAEGKWRKAWRESGRTNEKAAGNLRGPRGETMKFMKTAVNEQIARYE